MATFLTTKDIVGHLHRIIEQAAGELILISPYIKADDKTKRLLENTKRGTDIHVLYGKSQSERNLGNVKTSFDLPGITVSFLKDLHAKCYLNEKEALLTSMNLHESSITRNHEMAILVSKQDDAELYEAIYQDAKRLLRAANGESPVASASKPSAGKPMRIYVGNLNFQAADNDLQELFSQHGEVTFAQIEIDRYSMRSRGFGFVEMSNGSEAEAAISALNGQEYQGRQLSVNEATERR